MLDYRTVTEDELRQAIEIGLISPFAFMQSIAEGMAARGWGRIVNIASSAVKFPMQIRILSGGSRAAQTDCYPISSRMPRDYTFNPCAVVA